MTRIDADKKKEPQITQITQIQEKICVICVICGSFSLLAFGCTMPGECYNRQIDG